MRQPEAGNPIKYRRFLRSLKCKGTPPSPDVSVQCRRRRRVPEQERLPARKTAADFVS